MKILVPAATFDELVPRAAQIAPTSALLLVPYTEDQPLPAEAGDADGVLRWVAGKRFESLLMEQSSVRWLHTASAGTDHVLTDALRARGNFTLTDSGPAFGICIGEFVLAWMLAVAHRLPDLLTQQAEREWHSVRQEELYGQTVGIIGLGPIGQAIAARCRAFGMRTLGLRRTQAPIADVDTVLTGSEGLATLVAESDWIVVAAALTSETRALLGKEQFATMKPSARIVNIARGPLLDEDALIHALETGQLAGACLDVFAREPLPADSPLWHLPNVYVTPHTAPGWTAGLRHRQLDLFVENLRRFYAGEPLDNIVDWERGY